MNILKRIKHKTWESMKKIWEKVKITVWLIKYKAMYNAIKINLYISQRINEIKHGMRELAREIKHVIRLIIIQIIYPTWILDVLIKIEKWILKHRFFWKFFLFWIVFSIVALIAAWIVWPEIFNFYLYLRSVPSDAKDYSEIFDHLVLLVSAMVSYFGLSISLYLAIWGRIIQQKSHLHERLEKATAMLGSDAMGMRISACRLLMGLATDDKRMKVLCVNLLFAFINNPYLKDVYQDKDFDELFPVDKSLRPDIQSAINSFSAIYNYYEYDGIDNERVELPFYFWRNETKDNFSLIKANLSYLKLQRACLHQANLRRAILYHVNLQEAILWGADLQGANLSWADLQKINLGWANLQGAILSYANLQKADLSWAKLQGADLSQSYLQGANLRKVNLRRANFLNANLKGADLSGTFLVKAKNLTKEQVLSAIWGIGKDGIGGPPVLSKKLLIDIEVLEWLATPHYDNSKKE